MLTEPLLQAVKSGGFPVNDERLAVMLMAGLVPSDLAAHAEDILLSSIVDGASTPDLVAIAITQSKRAPDALLVGFLNHKQLEVRRAAALHPHAPDNLAGEVIEHWAKEIHSVVRAGITMNPRTTSMLLDQLSHDHWVIVREAVGRREGAPSPTLARLASDRQYEVRTAVAANPTAPLHLLQLLAMDRDSSVRAAAAANRNLDPDTMERLRADSSELVRLAASRNSPPGVPFAMPADAWEVFRRHAYVFRAQHPTTPVLSAEGLREMFARAIRPDVNPGELELASEGWSAFASELTSFRAKGGFVSQRLPTAQEAGLRSTTLNEMAFEPTPSLTRLLALLHPECPQGALVRCAGSSDWRERLAVSQHPTTPTQVVRQLSHDAHEVVSAMARRRISTTPGQSTCL